MINPREQHYSATWMNMDWEALIRYYPGERLLPNLLSFSCDDPTVAPYFHLFVQSPKLEHLQLTYADSNDAASLVKLLASLPPSLKKSGLDLLWEKHSSIVPGPTIQAAIGQAVSSMSCLTSFRTTRIAAETLAGLSALSQLRILQFGVYPMEHAETHPRTSRPYQFHALEYLVVSSTWFDTTSMVAFFDRASAPKLETVRIRVFSDDSEDLDESYDHEWNEWDEDESDEDGSDASEPVDDAQLHRDERPTAAALGELTASLRPFTTLRHFAIEAYFAPEVLPEHIATASILEPFLTMPCLEKLEFGYIPFALKAEDLARMARAWPELERLEIGQDVAHPPPTIQLEDLIPFALHCPKLRSLGLPLLVPENTRCLEYALPPGQSKSVLAVINAGDTEGIMISPAVKEFLARVFPRAVMSSRQISREAINKT